MNKSKKIIWKKKYFSKFSFCTHSILIVFFSLKLAFPKISLFSPNLFIFLFFFSKSFSFFFLSCPNLSFFFFLSFRNFSFFLTSFFFSFSFFFKSFLAHFILSSIFLFSSSKSFFLSYISSFSFHFSSPNLTFFFLFLILIFILFFLSSPNLYHIFLFLLKYWFSSSFFLLSFVLQHRFIFPNLSTTTVRFTLCFSIFPHFLHPLSSHQYSLSNILLFSHSSICNQHIREDTKALIIIKSLLQWPFENETAASQEREEKYNYEKESYSFRKKLYKFFFPPPKTKFSFLFNAKPFRNR